MINKFVIYLYLIVSAVFLSGCYGRYVNKGKSNDIVKGRFYSDKKLFVKNFILYKTLDYRGIFSNNMSTNTVSDDSLIKVLGSSLEALGLPLINKLSSGTNLTDEKYIRKHVLRLRKIDDNWIKSVAYNNNDSDSLILVPFIYLYNRIHFTAFFASSGAGGDNGFFVGSFFDMIIYVIDKNQIIYKKHIRYKSEKSPHFNTRQEAEENAFAPMIKQEHWDEIVRLAMKDYMKRLE